MMFTRGRRSLISLISRINGGYYEQACSAGPIEGWSSGGALAVTFRCLFCRMEQEVRKVAIWWVFISRWLPRWLNVSWRWSCRQLRGRAGPEAQGVPPGCSSSPLKEGQQSNESRSAPNLQLVLCQLYCFSQPFSVFSWNLIHPLCPGRNALQEIGRYQDAKAFEI